MRVIDNALPLEASPTDSLSAPATHSIAALRHYVPALDGVRGLAILVVMCCHFVWIATDPEAGGVAAPDKLSRLVIDLFKTGRYGVDLFFVLSGFLITGILYDAKQEKHYFRNFYARRTLRIFPLYYAVLLILFVIVPMFAPWKSPEDQRIVGNQSWLWLYMSNMINAFRTPDFFQGDRLWVGHFWSLAIEEQFYLIWPMIILLLNRTAAMRLTVVMMIGAALLRFGFMSVWPGKTGLNMALYFTFCKFDTLGLGAFLALAARSPDGLKRYVKIAPTVFVITVMLLAPLIVVKYDKSSTMGALGETLKLTLICFCCGSMLVLAHASNGVGIIGRFFTFPAMRFLGKYSYGIYIFHELFAPLFNGRLGIAALQPKLGNSWYLAMAVHFVSAFVISIAVALISWNILEKHMLKLKRFFEHEDPRPHKTAAMAGTPTMTPAVPHPPTTQEMTQPLQQVRAVS